jgi:hypothetical protein
VPTKLRLVLATSLLMTTGCAKPYTIPTEPPSVHSFCEVRVGMTKAQAESVMGRPDDNVSGWLTWEPRPADYFHWRFDAYVRGGVVRLLDINEAHLRSSEKRTLPCGRVRT